jgi:uncharacterized protein
MRCLFHLCMIVLLTAFAANAQPASLSGFEDEGTFNLVVNEDRVGVVNFKWLRDGTLNATMTISMAGQTDKRTTEIKADAQGAWTEITLGTARGPIKIVRNGSEATRTFQDKPMKFTIRDGSVLFDNNAPATLALAVRNYDAAKGGKQGFRMFVVQGQELDASMEPVEKLERTIGGRDLALTRYKVTLASADMFAFAGPDGKIYLVDIPSQKAAFIREGFEALRKAPETDPLLSQARFEVKIERAMVPMRDGVKLAADIYLPVADGKAPVILMRTPYKKDMMEIQGRYYARRGYATVIQDCRGRFGSEGVWEPFMNERKDGYDSVEWAAKQPWSNGKVGMIGASYLGWVQWWAAAERPPHLVTIIPNVAPPDPLYNIPYEYGVFFLTGAIWWANVLESNATGDLSGATLAQVNEKKYVKLLRDLPVIELDKAVLGKENPYWRKWIQHPSNDAYWKPANFLDSLKGLRIPVFHQSGWFDGDGIGSKLNYLRMVEGGAPAQKLILGPWGHTDTSTRRVGDRDFGEQALLDLQREYMRWLDHYLKGVDNGVTKEPLVRLFAMGSNQWLTGDRYPLPQTKFEKWYLASEGRLTVEPPPAKSAPHKYTYDPADPTPDPRFYEETEEEEKKLRDAEEMKKKPQQFYEQTLERKDILVFKTEPFKQRYTFVGPVSAVLHAASSAKDTDWFMRLVEVDKEGKFRVLVMGKVRARYRNSLAKPQLLSSGKVYEYQLDLWHTGITIPEGSRLQVEVASAAFPLFSRNLNTGGHNETETRFVKAEQAIYHDAARPSHVLLPMIPELSGMESRAAR